MKQNLTRKQAIQELWKLADLSYMLKGVQKDMRDAVYNSSGKKTVFLCSRRLGKSFSMCLIATEYCIKTPNTIVKYLCPKKKDAKTIIRPIMRIILEDCPISMKPEWKEADKVYEFPNGSQVQIGGTDSGNAESIRGGYANLAIFDEAGFHDYNDFPYIVQSIVLPTLLTTKGKMILASTPSKEPDHPFMVDYVHPARNDNTIIEYDIYSNPLITQEDIDEIAEEFPLGKEDPAFQREFLLKSVIDSDSIVIPEWNKELERDLVQERKIPTHYDAYVSGDPAAKDLTAILFAYYDFKRAKIVVADELVLGGEGTALTTQVIADGVKRKESLLFMNEYTGETKEPYLRIMDNNQPILMNDLYNDHGLLFVPTQKDTKDQQINKLRMMLSQGSIEVSPKCKNLIYHIKTAKWDKKRKGFQRVKGSSDGKLKAHHCDALDALIYLVRNVQLGKNPYPDGYFDLTGEDVHNPNGVLTKEERELSDFMKKIMNIRKS